MLPEPHPWEPYAVGTPSATAWVNQDCQVMTTISHVTHIDNAIAILKLGKIRPQLVYDHSILNQDRILVNWLSPNHWANGYRYGNVCFEYKFESLIEGKRIYWVESMTDYNPAALRFLVTEQDRSVDSRLRAYNPCDQTGPWWHDAESGIHYRNGHYTLEFMLEDEILISDAQSISTVKHHPTFCCVDSANCPDRGMSPEVAGEVFAAGVAIHEINCLNLPFDEIAYNHFATRILWDYHGKTHSNFTGDPDDTAIEPALAHAWLSATYFRKSEYRQILKQRFASREHFLRAVARPLMAFFGAEKMSALHATEDI